MQIINVRPRLYWIDWMKSIGMFFIIAGHIFPLGYEFLYVFSVPLFFLISGYLGHRETNDKLFWQKTFSNLIIPCIIISLVLHIEQIVAQVRLGTFEWINIPTHVINCLMGNLALHTKASGIGICWFIYTLVLCKVIQQFVSKSKKANVVVLIVCLAVAVWYNINDMHLCNAYTNITLAYPLYAIGGGYKLLNVNKLERVSPILEILGSLVGVIVVIAIGIINGAPWMYDATYGSNIILFFVGGLAGTMSVFCISYLLRNIKSKTVLTISKGTIIILGFHQLIIRIYDRLPDFFHTVFYEYIAALFILLFFIPIIKLSEKYFPLLLGKRAERK